jgi:5-oxoprolinase (ATP-hydrolysing)
MVKIVPRAQSATTDVYLSPIIQRYLDGFAKGFIGEFKNEKSSKELLLSQSDRSLTTFKTLRVIERYYRDQQEVL